MKSSPLAEIKIAAVLATACLLLGCEAPISTASEEPLPPVYPVVATQPVPQLVTVSNAVPQPVAPEPSGNGEPTAGPPPAAPAQLPDRLQEVVKLAQSGVGDEVILAYIQNSPVPFNPSPDEILYLTDLGISDVVVTALVDHKGMQMAAPPAQAPPPAPSMAQMPPPPAEADVPMEATYNPEPGILYNPPPAVDYGPPPPAVDYDYFYSSLAPYGSWVDVADYGWCWQPTVVVVNRGWRPYCDHGRWLYTDCGYYWQSDYSWGWAPFHYGRWFHHPVRGWCWRPDSVWAPAWVSWRYTDSYCGWAPLPPGARYHEGVGFSYYGASVGVSFGFGLHGDAWTFVPAHRFHDHEVWRYRVPPTEHAAVYRQSKVSNNYSFRDHTIVNRGVAEHVPILARNEPRKVVVRDLPEQPSALLRPDRLRQDGAQTVVYRPKPPVQNQGPRTADSSATRTVHSQNIAGAGGAMGLTPTPTGRQQGGRNAPGVTPTGTGRPANARPAMIEPNRIAEVSPNVSTTPSRSEPTRVSPATPPVQSTRPGTPPTATPATRQEPPRTAVMTPTARPPTPTSQVVRTPTTSADPAPAVERPSTPALAAPARQEVVKPSAPATVQRPVTRSPAPAYQPTQPIRPAPQFTPTVQSRPSTPPSSQVQSPPARSYSPLAVQSRPSPSYQAPAVESRPAPSYTPPAVQTRPAPSYTPPAVQSRPVPSYTPSLAESRPAPSYSAPTMQSRPTPYYSAPAVQSRPTPSYSAPAVQSRPTPSYSAPAVQSRPTPSYSAPAVQSRPTPSYSAPAAQSRPAPSYSPPAVQSRPAPSYSAPASRPVQSSGSTSSGNRRQY